MPAELTRVTAGGAEAILTKLADMFMVPSINLAFDCTGCGETYGCYWPDTNTICLQLENGTVFGYVVVHEFGHALEAMYTGDKGFSYQQGEGFARHMEQLYLSTDGKFLDFKCDCGVTELRLLPDGSVQCIQCGSIYYAALYNWSLVTG